MHSCLVFQQFPVVFIFICQYCHSPLYTVGAHCRTILFFSVNCTLSLMFSVSRSSSCGTLGSLGSPVSTLHVASDLSRSNTSPGAVSAVSAASQTVDDTDSAPLGVNTEAPSELENAAAGAEAITFRCSSPSAANHHGGSLPHPSSMPSIRQPLVSSLG